jgi:uncharacterized protein
LNERPARRPTKPRDVTDSIEFVRGLYAAFSSGDLPGFLPFLAPDVVWNGAEGFPYADGAPYYRWSAVAAGVFERQFVG